MASPHISKERLNALVFDTVHLTEEEDSHVAEGGCPECKSAILEIVLNRREVPECEWGWFVEVPW
jgi:hypothetical protein